MTIIELKNINKTYGKGESATVALTDVNLKIQEGEFWAIMGPSGSGKSTLLNILGCMDVPSSGDYLLKGKKLSQSTPNQLSRIRNQTVSFIFQQFALLNDYNIYDNIELPLLCQKLSKKERKDRVQYYMERLGIQSLARKKPTQISGGQQQRVAIARALVTKADIILADEPTGALDQKTGREVLDFLKKLNREGNTIVMITHDSSIAREARRVVRIHDGKINFDGDVEDYAAII